MTRRTTRGPKLLKTAAGSSPRAAEFPALAGFVRGYLHQDFPEVHGSIVAAAAAFCADAGAEERRQLAVELEALSNHDISRSSRQLRRFVVGDLGSGWTPTSRDDLVVLLGVIRASI
ncbi:MAG: contact-dependent growth inhibition system immunity protein [Vicinamibacterales bacterium]